MSTYLKKVYKEDCDLLFIWANNEEVRKNSFNLNKIRYEDHIKWFADKTRSTSSYMFILYEEKIPMGQIRVDIIDSTGIVGYSIDSKYRGKGYGTKILELLERQVLIINMQVNKLIGEVKYSNKASQKAFEKNRYIKLEKEKYIQYYKKLL